MIEPSTGDVFWPVLPLVDLTSDAQFGSSAVTAQVAQILLHYIVNPVSIWKDEDLISPSALRLRSTVWIPQ